MVEPNAVSVGLPPLVGSGMFLLSMSLGGAE